MDAVQFCPLGLIMKLITLNIWGGKVFKPLINFLKVHAKNTDIFCFQEVFHTTTIKKISNKARVNIYKEIKNILSDFQDYYAPAQDGFDYKGAVTFNLSFGLAMFVKDSIHIDEHGDVFVFRARNARKNDNTSLGRNLEYITFKKDNSKITVFNLHGLWNGRGKTDTEDRLEQSRKIKAFMNKFSDSKKILCGDFNLLPDTKSLAILSDGMKNLVKDFDITSTRSKLYTKPEKFADYILVSPDVNVQHFEALQDEVSDHLPLLLEFD